MDHSSPAQPSYDPRELGRLVATVLFAGGPVGADLRAQADAAIARFGAAPLADRDFVVTTPEEIAPLIPPALRRPLAGFLLQLSEGDPLRRRAAIAYLGLWQLPAPSHSPAAGTRAPIAESVARRVIGPLPAHHGDIALPETPMMNEPTNQPGYRATTGEALRAPPVVDPLRERVRRISLEMRAVVDSVERVILGKREIISRVLTAMTAGGHVLLVDAPGVGKTQLCKAIAAAIGVGFGRVQFTPDLLPMDVTGATIYDPHKHEFIFRPGPVFTNILLADEINRATPKTQSALLEVMEERTVTVDGTTHPMADPFQVLATMNPIDHDGTFPLPAAQIDRFMVMLEIGYPSPDDEVRMLDTHLRPDPERIRLSPAIAKGAFQDWQNTVGLIHASHDVKRAAVYYVNALRRSTGPDHTVSPRTTLAWMRAAQARALFAGREFVTVDDLLDMGADVLRHRLWLSAPEVRDRLRGLTPQIGHAAQ